MAHEVDEQPGTGETGPADDAARRPLDLAGARRSAIDALTAYRAARDPSGLAAVFRSLSEDVPAHWLVTGLLSVANQLVGYLAASEKVDPVDVLRALTSLDVEAGLGAHEGTERGADALVDEQGKESFPASDPPSNWAGEDGPPGA